METLLASRWPAPTRLTARTRAHPERLLDAVVARVKRRVATPAEIRTAALWRDVRQLRGVGAPARPDASHGAPATKACPAALLAAREELVRSNALAEILRSGPEQLLVAPLGSSPGALFTAIRSLPADSLIVATSKEGALRVPEVLVKAGYAGSAPTVLSLRDPFSGFDEIEAMAEISVPHLVGVSRVHVSVTGGTTVLQWLCLRIWEIADELGCPGGRYALVDPRDAAAQREDPYRVGRCISLDE